MSLKISEKHRILVVDDEPDIRQLVSEILEDEGYQVVVAETADADFRHAVLGAQNHARNQVRLTDEIGNKGINRLIINRLRRSHLLNDTVIHDYDGI